MAIDNAGVEMEMLDRNNDSGTPQLIFHPIIIQMLNKKINNESTLDPEEILTIIGIYSTLYHPHSCSTFFKQLQHAPNQKSAKTVFRAIKSWEFRRADHSSDAEAMDCIISNLEQDLELKQWILDVLDDGLFSKLKRKLLSIVPGFLKTNSFLNFMDLCQTFIRIIMFYVDLVKDYAAFILFDHMTSEILVSSIFLHLQSIQKP